MNDKTPNNILDIYQRDKHGFYLGKNPTEVGVFVVNSEGKKALIVLPVEYETVKGAKRVYPDENGVLVINEDIDFISDYKFAGPANDQTFGVRRLVINSNVPVTIGVGAFHRNREIESIEINCPDVVTIKNNAFKDCSNLRSFIVTSGDKDIREMYFENSAFANCTSLEEFSVSKAQYILLDDLLFDNCPKLRRLDFDTEDLLLGNNLFTDCNQLSEFSFSNNLFIYPASFEGCKSLSRIRVDSINNIKTKTNSQLSEIVNSGLNDIIIEIDRATVDDLLKYEKCPNFRINYLIIDSLNEQGIEKLKELFRLYNSKEYFNHILAGSFEISNSIIDNVNDLSEQMIYYMVRDVSNETRMVLTYASTVRKYDNDFSSRFLKRFDKDALEKNAIFFKELVGTGFSSVGIPDLFVNNPLLFEVDFRVIFDNIKTIREYETVRDEDIVLCYFGDNSLSVNLDDEESMKQYIVDYIKLHKTLPKAMNSLLCYATIPDIVDFVDRINYVTTMNLNSREREEFLCKDSIDIIESVDDESFNSIFGDYKERASKYNDKVAILRGIKSKVYEKLKGYLNQSEKENILFDECFGSLVDDVIGSYATSAILDYFYKVDSNIFSVVNSTNKELLEYKRNIICGRILYQIICAIKYDLGLSTIDEDTIRDYLYNFKDSYIHKNINECIFGDQLFDATEPDSIEVMLKIDPYSFDMFRNFSFIEDIPIKQQLDSILEQNNATRLISREIIEDEYQTRFLVNEHFGSSEIVIGYDDVRYYRLAKANGYRFTKEEDEYYEREIEKFNKQIDELLEDPKYARFRNSLESYRIEEVNTKPDIMRVFYEFLQNEITPSNIPFNKRHDFENRVKILVDEFIEEGSKEGTRLSKILYSVDMLYRNNNPSILYIDTEEIIERPLLISNPNISNVQKIGVALVALNKMAHQQTSDFIPSEYYTRFRYKSEELRDELQESSEDLVAAMTTLGNYVDIEDAYRRLFTNNKLLNNDYYDYIDNGSYEKLLLTKIDDKEAKEIFDFTMANRGHLKKLAKRDFSNAISREVIEFYNKYKDYVIYIFKNEDTVNNTNPLIITKEEKDKIEKDFNDWVFIYNRFKNHNDPDIDSERDYIRIFRSLRKIREGIRRDPKVVESLLDNAISQRNMYDLKQRFADILVNELLDELNNTESKDSVEVLNTIINLTKEEKIELFKEQGIIVEIQEDYMSPDKDVLVIYSNSMVEPYSIHLTSKLINDTNRDNNRNNRLIVNSQLDNKNLTPVEEGFTFDFSETILDFSDNFKSLQSGRANAVLLNFININIPVLLNKYGISRDLISKILNGNIIFSIDNFNTLIDPYVLELYRSEIGLDDEEIFYTINNIINGIKEMVDNLIKNNELKIPEDMELDSEFEYLKGYKFTNIDPISVVKIRSMLGNNNIKYDETCSDYYESMMKKYNNILSDPNNSLYPSTLRKIFMAFTSPFMMQFTDSSEYKVCSIGDDDVSFLIPAKKASNSLERKNICIDMSTINDDEEYRDKMENYLGRMCIGRAKKNNNDLEYQVKTFDKIINEIRTTGNYVYSRGRLKVYNIREEFKQILIERLEKEKQDVINIINGSNSVVMGEVSPKTTPPVVNSSKNELLEMFEGLPEEIVDSIEDNNTSGKK